MPKKKNMKKEIIKFYEDKHIEEVEKTKQKIPQTMQGKKIRYLLKLIEEIK